jgi:hypothetical protein
MVGLFGADFVGEICRSHIMHMNSGIEYYWLPLCWQILSNVALPLITPVADSSMEIPLVRTGICQLLYILISMGKETLYFCFLNKEELFSQNALSSICYEAARLKTIHFLLGQLSQCSVWLQTGRPVFDPLQRQSSFLLASVFRPALRPTQPPIQWVVLLQVISRV